MPEKTTILYVRQSSGGGGGADTVILNSTTHLDSKKFFLIIAYLRKANKDLSAISKKFRSAGIQYFESPGKKIFDVKQFIDLIKLIRRYNVRIVHCHDPKADVYGYLLKLFLPSIILISTIHGWTGRSSKGRLYAKIDRLVLKCFDAVIVVSEYLQKHESINSNTFVIQNGIDAKKWQPSNQDKNTKHFNIGFVGRISREKGPLDFVHVSRRVLNLDDDCRFFVAGEGPEQDAMKRMVSKLNLGNRFFFLGQLDYLQLKKLYQKLDLLLLTSYTEGLPMTILEACAMEIPVVSTNVGGVPEIIRNNYNGLLVESGDIDTLAEKILTIKQNPVLAEKLRRNGRDVVKRKFSYPESIRKLEKIYEKQLQQ